MFKEKRNKICLIEALNEIDSGTMDKFSNEKQTGFRLFNFHSMIFKAF